MKSQITILINEISRFAIQCIVGFSFISAKSFTIQLNKCNIGLAESKSQSQGKYVTVCPISF